MTDEEDMMLDELLELDHGLDDWTVNFIEDLANRRKENENYRLSEKQHDKLREKWDQFCG